MVWVHRVFSCFVYNNDSFFVFTLDIFIRSVFVYIIVKYHVCLLPNVLIKSTYVTDILIFKWFCLYNTFKNFSEQHRNTTLSDCNFWKFLLLFLYLLVYLGVALLKRVCFLYDSLVSSYCKKIK